MRKFHVTGTADVLVRVSVSFGTVLLAADGVDAHEALNNALSVNNSKAVAHDLSIDGVICVDGCAVSAEDIVEVIALAAGRAAGRGDLRVTEYEVTDSK